MDRTARRRTEITIETREIKTIRIRTSGSLVACATCGKHAAPYAIGSLAELLDLDLTELRHYYETGILHSIAGDDDEICGNSLCNIS